MALGAAATLGVTPALAEERLSLAQALAIARAANAQLPVAALDVQVAAQRLREANAMRWAQGSVEAELVYAPKGADYGATTDVNRERLQFVVRQPIYAGGEIRGGIDVARADLGAADARYRAAEKDVERDVRLRYDEFVEIEAVLDARREGVQRLQSYLTFLEQLEASGQGVQSDVLKTRVRLANELAAIHGDEQQLAIATAEMNDLLGRDPRTPLALTPLPPPAPPTLPATAFPWMSAPEIREAQEGVRSAAASTRVARAGRRPHVDVLADAGLFGPGFTQSAPGQSFGSRVRDDLGVSAGLTLTWPIFDFGIYGARVSAARLRTRRAEWAAEVAMRAARLSWARAAETRALLYRELSTRRDAVPVARDAYLVAESQYRGGVGTALDVLDAYSSWIGTREAYELALRAYRDAAAELLRWGMP